MNKSEEEPKISEKSQNLSCRNASTQQSFCVEALFHLFTLVPVATGPIILSIESVPHTLNVEVGANATNIRFRL